MALDAANAPGTGWIIGTVVCHNPSWITQRCWNFTMGVGSTVYERRNGGGPWSGWVAVSGPGSGSSEINYIGISSDYAFVNGESDWINGLGLIADGVSAYYLEFFCPDFYSNGDGNSVYIKFYEGAAFLGMVKFSGSEWLNEQMPVTGKIRIVPAAGGHTYRLAVNSTNANGGLYANGYCQSFFRVFKA
jgi:hypothetical protein